MAHDSQDATARILVAETSFVRRHVLECTLRRWGYDVVTAGDGVSAWRVLRAPDAPPLALLDRTLPGMDGLTVCRRVRGLDRGGLPYLVLLAPPGSPADLVAGFDSGADDWVSRPVDLEVLRARLLVGRRRVALLQRLAAEARRLEQLCGRGWRGAGNLLPPE